MRCVRRAIRMTRDVCLLRGKKKERERTAFFPQLMQT